jgi:transposase
VVAHAVAGQSRREVARRFGISASFVVVLMARVERTGSVAAAKRGRPFGFGKLAGMRDALIARVEAASDTTLAELTDWLARVHDVRVHLYSVCRVLRAAGFTCK